MLSIIFYFIFYSLHFIAFDFILVGFSSLYYSLYVASLLYWIYLNLPIYNYFLFKFFHSFWCSLFHMCNSCYFMTFYHILCYLLNLNILLCFILNYLILFYFCCILFHHILLNFVSFYFGLKLLMFYSIFLLVGFGVV